MQCVNAATCRREGAAKKGQVHEDEDRDDDDDDDDGGDSLEASQRQLQISAPVFNIMHYYKSAIVPLVRESLLHAVLHWTLWCKMCGQASMQS